jgi:hypothetical protein
MHVRAAIAMEIKPRTYLEIKVRLRREGTEFPAGRQEGVMETRAAFSQRRASLSRICPMPRRLTAEPGANLSY